MPLLNPWLKLIGKVLRANYGNLQHRMFWLTRVCVKWHGVLQGHRKVGKLIIPIHRKGDRSECTNYWGISLLSLQWKVYAKCLVKRCREIIEPKLDDTQCGFRHGCSTTEKNSPLQQMFEKSWEHAKHVYTCFSSIIQHSCMETKCSSCPWIVSEFASHQYCFCVAKICGHCVHTKHKK